MPFWIARVARTGALPVVAMLKDVAKSSVTLRRQSLRTKGVLCNTSRPVDATVSNVIKKELIIVIATGQCDLRSEVHKASGFPGVI